MTACQLPRVLIVTLAVATFTACGAESSTSSSPPSDDDAGALRAPVAVEAVGGWSPAPGGGATPMSAESADSADMSTMPAFFGFTYEVGDELSALPDNSTGYEYPTGADIDEATVAAVAAALDMDATPERVDDEATGMLWQAGPVDGTAPSLGISRDSQLSWYYSAAWADQEAVACDEVGVDPMDVPPGTDVPAATVLVGGDGAVDADVGDRSPCVAAEPPAGVPTEAEAEEATTDLLAALGEDPATFELETYADEWAASVTAWPSLGGVRSPVAWGFGFGAEGIVQWANGSLARPVPAGPYPLVDLDTAVARLTEQASPMPAMEVEPLVDETVADSATVETLVAVPGTDLGLPAEPEVATLVGVRADLWWTSDADGSVWLLPAYTFVDTEGRQHTAPAVTDEFLTIAEPVPTEPVEPPTTTNPSVSTPPVVDPVTTTTSLLPTAPDTTIDPATVVGLTVDEATAMLADQGLTLRIVREDGVDLAVTADLIETRVNVEVESGAITAVASMG